ncbi:hypothetical protein [Lacisediminimonas profundi]|uniref:hypothetical protein n=1 Tax=Lacisediminimonas profundi TaxID=2603856 RepID=UPI00124B51D3|nr:hypothetical protein [Lacisediminimonas profundi]
MSSPSRDAGIPVLTEVIEAAQEPTAQVAGAGAPGAAAEASAPLEVQVPATAPASIEELEARAIASMGSADWARLERALRERILRQLLARVDTTLEHRVRDSLADVLQGAVSTLATDIRSGLHQSLEEMIVRAVSQEIARLRSTQN